MLESLENSSVEVGGNFYCSYNNLKNLIGLPSKISGYSIRFIQNPLESLEGFNGDYDKLTCDNKQKLIRKAKLKIIKNI